MSVPPQTNGMLLTVMGVGFSRDGRRDPVDAPPKWQGESPVFVYERLKTTFGAAELNRVFVTTVYMDAELTMDPPLQSGDRIAYEYQGRIFQGTLQNLFSPYLPGAPSYTQADLEEINAS